MIVSDMLGTEAFVISFWFVAEEMDVVLPKGNMEAIAG